MNTSLVDLNRALFEQLEAVSDADFDIDGAKADFTLKRAKAVTEIANTIVGVHTHALNVARLRANAGYDVPANLLEGGER